MARLALVNASAGTATAVRAAAGAHEIVSCGPDAVPGDAELIVLDAGASVPSADFLSRLAGPRPLLVLIDRRARVDFSAVDHFIFLRKPCEIVDLRSQVQAMLDAQARPAAAGGAALDSGDDAFALLEVPRIPATVVATLRLARRLGGPVWIAGEPGTGTDLVAGALAVAWDAGREPLVWPEDEALEHVTGRLSDPRRVLWAPGLDERSVGEQRAFERFLAMAGPRRVVVTTGDDAPLPPSLLRVLGRVALRLPPLRERSAEIATLAAATGASVAAAAFEGARFALADSARRSLETYEWPGNLDELDAVVTRSVLGGSGAPGGLVELAEADLRYAPDFVSAAMVRAGEAPAPRRGVVVPLTGARGLENASAPDAQIIAAAALSAGTSSDSGVEAVLSAFAHDIRNPMSTLKTFASLAAADATGDSGELARLATGAAERIDGHLEFLQRYTELVAGDAAPSAARVDAVDVLGDAIEAAGDGLQLAARSELWSSGDPEVLRFIADALVAESLDRVTEAAGRTEGEATADVSADKRSIEIRIPVGGAAVDRLGKWVEGRGLPWRLALARDLARRGGGDLGMDVDDGEMRVRWTPAPAAEEAEVGRDGGQARSADRRRRSRSS
jgi:signal transduction histidine kinase